MTEENLKREILGFFEDRDARQYFALCWRETSEYMNNNPDGYINETPCKELIQSDGPVPLVGVGNKMLPERFARIKDFVSCGLNGEQEPIETAIKRDKDELTTKDYCDCRGRHVFYDIDVEDDKVNIVLKIRESDETRFRYLAEETVGCLDCDFLLDGFYTGLGMHDFYKDKDMMEEIANKIADFILNNPIKSVLDIFKADFGKDISLWSKSKKCLDMGRDWTDKV